eukprot:4319063-Prymnesium_polylepis.1
MDDDNESTASGFTAGSGRSGFTAGTSGDSASTSLLENEQELPDETVVDRLSRRRASFRRGRTNSLPGASALEPLLKGVDM